MTYLTFTKDDIMRGAELGVMALLGLIVLLMVVRPLVRRIVTPDRPAVAQIAGMAGVAGAVGVAVNADGTAVTNGNGSGTISSDGGANISIVGGGEQVAISNRTSAMIDVAKVQGQVHAQSIQKVGEMAEKNPQEAVSIIRGWLHEDAA
jgi:flagellar M-ring protein FliF